MVERALLGAAFGLLVALADRRMRRTIARAGRRRA
jgi:hypothetical protein